MNKNIDRYLDLQELRKAVDDSFIASQIARRLPCCSPTDDAEQLAARMTSSQSQICGVQKNDVVVGYVLRKQLSKGPVEKYLCRFQPKEIVAHDTRLNSIVFLLLQQPYLFVLKDEVVTDYITAADLQTSPVRNMLCAMLSMFGTYLSEMVKICYPGSLLAQQDIGKAALARRVRQFVRTRDTDLTNYIDFPEKRQLLAQFPGVFEFLGLSASFVTDLRFRELESLRNRLSDGQVLNSVKEWQSIPSLLIALESTFHIFDSHWEEFVRRFAAVPNLRLSGHDAIRTREARSAS
jgi:hypothetical protein